MPVRVAVAMEVANPEKVRTPDLHYHLCRWLELGDAEHRASEKPFAISPLTRLDDGLCGFEIGLLEDCLARRLHRVIQRDRSRTLQLGKTTARLCPSEPLRLIEACRWTDMACASLPTYAWEIDALSPTFWRRGKTDVFEPRAGSIVTGLARRWQRWSPVELSGVAAGSANTDEPAELAHVSILPEYSSIEIVDMAWRRRTRRGFVGTLVLVAQEGPAAARTRVDALLRLAEFCGIGSMTPFGFGVTAVRPIR